MDNHIQILNFEKDAEEYEVKLNHNLAHGVLQFAHHHVWEKIPVNKSYRAFAIGLVKIRGSAFPIEIFGVKSVQAR